MNPGEHNQGLRHYPFIVSLGKFNESCNTFDNIQSRLCVINKTWSKFKWKEWSITERNELKTLIKHTLCSCRCKLDRKKCNSNQKWNN